MSEQRCKRLSKNISTYIPTYLWPWLQRGSRRDKNRRSRRKDEKLYKRHRRKAHTCSASTATTPTKEVSQKKKFVRGLCLDENAISFTESWILHNGIIPRKGHFCFEVYTIFYIEFKISDKWVSEWVREREKKIFNRVSRIISNEIQIMC